MNRISNTISLEFRFKMRDIIYSRVSIDVWAAARFDLCASRSNTYTPLHEGVFNKLERYNEQ